MKKGETKYTYTLHIFLSCVKNCLFFVPLKVTSLAVFMVKTAATGFCCFLSNPFHRWMRRQQ